MVTNKDKQMTIDEIYEFLEDEASACRANGFPDFEYTSTIALLRQLQSASPVL